MKLESWMNSTWLWQKVKKIRKKLAKIFLENKFNLIMLNTILFTFLIFTNINLFSNPISHTKKDFKKKDKNCLFQIQYPVFNSKKNDLIPKINSLLEKTFLEISEYYNEFECNAGETNFNLNRNFEIKFVDENLISIHSYSSSFSEGSPHPFNKFQTFNINLKTGEEIKLNQVFKINKFFRRKIRNLISKNLAEQGITSEFKMDKPEYYFTKKEIVFINLFEDYPNESIEAKILISELEKFKEK